MCLKKEASGSAVPSRRCSCKRARTRDRWFPYLLKSLYRHLVATAHDHTVAATGYSPSKTRESLLYLFSRHRLPLWSGRCLKPCSRGVRKRFALPSRSSPLEAVCSCRVFALPTEQPLKVLIAHHSLPLVRIERQVLGTDHLYPDIFRADPSL